MSKDFIQLTEKQSYALEVASANLDSWFRKYRMNHNFVKDKLNEKGDKNA